MRTDRSESLFNWIAPLYGLFYHKQKRHFSKIVNGHVNGLDLKTYASVLDVGCGTGALCAVLHKSGLTVTGVDTAEKMLQVASKNHENKGISFIHANAIEALPFSDKCFDISIASYVAHGMGQYERKRLYAEMSRVTKFKVVIYDYNETRTLLTTIIEWLERGDYFHFIKNAETEMRECHLDSGACFSAVQVIDVDSHAAWYICTPF